MKQMKVVAAIIRKRDKIFAPREGMAIGRTGGSFLAERFVSCVDHAVETLE